MKVSRHHGFACRQKIIVSIGYSVFAVLPVSEGVNAPRTLPRTEADDIASTLPEPSSHMGTRLSTSHTSIPGITGALPSKAPAPASDFEDEDLELQAALQASLTSSSELSYAEIASSTTASSSSILPTRETAIREAGASHVNDPLAASMARNKAIMQRMQREQEMALRGDYEEEVALSFGTTNGTEPSHSVEPSQGREEQTTSEVEEEEAIRRAIEVSRTDGNGADDDHGAMDIMDDDTTWHPLQPSGRSLPMASTDRVYDDEDSELQAALKASLEGLPEGFVVPPTLPQARVSGTVPNVVSAKVASEKDEEEEEKPREVDAEEMRRRRLARFDG